MPDITMCKDDRCPFKRECRRFTSKPDNFQSYFASSQYNVKKNKCEYFLHNGSQPYIEEFVDLPVENKAVDFADELIGLILKYEIGNATFEKAKVIIERKNVWAEVDRKRKSKKTMRSSAPACSLEKKNKQPVVTVSLEEDCAS